MPDHEQAYQELLAALAGAFRSLKDPDCAGLLGPRVPGGTLTQGARVPGTSLELEPALAAFNLGAMMNGAALAAILPVADYLARKAHNEASAPLRVSDVLAAMHQARANLRSECAIAGVMHLLGAGVDELSAAMQLDRPAHPGASAGRRACAEAAAYAVQVSFQVMAGASPASLKIHRPAAPEVPRGCALHQDFAASVDALFPVRQAALIHLRIADRASVGAMPVHEFVALLVRNG